jgi:hypothetical protein
MFIKLSRLFVAPVLAALTLMVPTSVAPREAPAANAAAADSFVSPPFKTKADADAYAKRLQAAGWITEVYGTDSGFYFVKYSRP